MLVHRQCYQPHEKRFGSSVIGDPRTIVQTRCHKPIASLASNPGIGRNLSKRTCWGRSKVNFYTRITTTDFCLKKGGFCNAVYSIPKAPRSRKCPRHATESNLVRLGNIVYFFNFLDTGLFPECDVEFVELKFDDLNFDFEVVIAFGTHPHAPPPRSKFGNLKPLLLDLAINNPSLTPMQLQLRGQALTSHACLVSDISHLNINIIVLHYCRTKWKQYRGFLHSPPRPRSGGYNWGLVVNYMGPVSN